MQIDEIKSRFLAIFEAVPEHLVVRVDPISDTTFLLSISLELVKTLDSGKLESAIALAKEAGMEFQVHPMSEEWLWVEMRKEPVTLAL